MADIGNISYSYMDDPRDGDMILVDAVLFNLEHNTEKYNGSITRQQVQRWRQMLVVIHIMNHQSSRKEKLLMKHRKIGTVFMISMFLLFTVTSVNVSAKVKEKTKTIGNFKYTYTNYQTSSIWITEITPLSGKGIETLNIPSEMDGKKVVKIGGKYDNDANYVTDNIFGMWRNEENSVLLPKKVTKRVKKIKRIVLPQTVKKITPHACSELQKGKVINIPSGVTKNVADLCKTKWKKITISSKNKKYQTKDGLLLSKNGETLYGLASSIAEAKIPEGVEQIENAGYLFSNISYVYIPTSVKKIDFGFTHRTSNFVKIQVSSQNQRYAVTKDCLYHKISGCLIAASVRSSTFTVPQEVTSIENTFFTGNLVNRIIIPSSVRKVGACWGMDYSTVSSVFPRTPPPLLEGINADGATFYVPKGCKNIYQKATQAAYAEVKIYEM